ncbi:unnamed protein product [Diplocarpon coronariae]
MADGAGVDGASSLNKPIPNPTSPALGDMEVHPSSNPIKQRRADSKQASYTAPRHRDSAVSTPPHRHDLGPSARRPLPAAAVVATHAVSGGRIHVSAILPRASVRAVSVRMDRRAAATVAGSRRREDDKERGRERMQTERSTLHTPPGGDPDVLTQTHHDRPVGTVKPKVQPPERAESIGGTMH